MLLLLTVLCYLPALRAGYIWDDDYYVTKNILLRNAEGLKRIWFDIGATPQYYPLVFSSFWIEFHVYGLNPIGYHLINVLLHATNAVLLFLILQRIGLKWALLGAALFAVHPVHVESVAWITERKNVMSAAFYLAAILAYLSFDVRRQDASNAKASRRYYILALCLFVGALLSKTVTATLPAAILLLTYFVRGKITRRDWLSTLPMFVLGLGFGLLTAWMEKSEVGARGTDWDFSVIERFLIAGRVCWFYLSKLLLPFPLIFIYPRWNIDDRIWWQYLYPMAAIALIAGLWLLRRRIGRGPLVALLFFGGTLLPALGFVNVYPMRFSFVADHFQYLASIGPLVLIAALWQWLYRKFSVDRPALRGTLSAALVVPCTILVWNQLRIYKDSEALWRDTLAKNPEAWMAHGNLAATLTEQGRTQEALEHAEVVLRVRPDLPSTYVNYGDILIRLHRVQEAEAAYNHALQIDAGHLKAHFGLGDLLLDHGRPQEAIPHLRIVVESEPEFTATPNRLLAQAYGEVGQTSEALAHFRRALEIKPRFPEALHGMARVYIQLGNAPEAIACFQKLIAIKPDYPEAFNDLATIFSSLGDKAKAIKCLQEAIRLKPDYGTARFNLATLLAGEGRTQEAAAHLELVLRANPNDVEAKARLFELRLDAGKP